MRTTTSAELGYQDLPSLMARLTGDQKHDHASASTLDVLWVLYDRVLDISADRLADPARDRFLLSKGHGPSAYYAVLAAKGFVPVEWLSGFGDFDSALGHHPDRVLVPGVEISSGSLGHGLPLGVGIALGLRAQKIDARVVVLVGDAELNEGSNAEALEFAAASELDALTVVAIDNASTTWPWRGGLETRFEVAGWESARVPGRDHSALAAALARRPGGNAPHLVVAEVEAAS
ncbi:MAG: thiamine pyrophosphate-dependent enzyme [Ornithinibacter sp.]